MRSLFLSTALIASMGLAACEDQTRYDQRQLVGAAAGAAAGLLTAEVFDANDEWTVVAALAGAALGTQVARNQRTGECAYYRGNGYYEVRPC